MAATPVTALVIEAIRNTVSSVIDASIAEAPPAERALVERAVAIRRQRNDARHAPVADRGVQQAVDIVLCHAIPPDLLRSMPCCCTA